jgi:hypothetical protein
MRQGQHNKNRSRNRNSGGGGGSGGGRRQQNPVNRVFESNGPDVKIRGNASHVAEKYTSLARDALVSGNTVTAENYFQHAEHYLRILAAAQAYNQQQAVQAAPPVRAPEPVEAAEAAGTVAPESSETREQRPRGGQRRRRPDAGVESAVADAPQPETAVEKPVEPQPALPVESVEEQDKPAPKAKKTNGAAKKRKKADVEADSAKLDTPPDDDAAKGEKEDLPASA